MASDERGTKRTCPVTGKKFYDLNKDPVVSPYTGKSYPVSFFQAAPEKPAKPVEKARPVEKSEEADVDTAAEAAGAEVISLSDAEPEKSGKNDSSDDDDDDENSENIPGVADVEVDEELSSDDDSFLESDDDDDEAIDFNVEVDNEDDR